MKKQFAVIGLGRFGSEVARTLSKKGVEVIAVDREESRIKDVSEVVTVSVQLDATDEKALREAGVQNADVAIVSIGENIEASILVVMTLKDIGIKDIVVKAVSEMHGRILRQLGVRRIVHPERDMAQKVAYSLIRADVLELIELSPEYSIAEFVAPDFVQDMTIAEVNMRAKHGITVIAIKPPDAETWNINPHSSDMIQKGDLLVVLGSNDDIKKFNALK